MAQHTKKPPLKSYFVFVASFSNLDICLGNSTIWQKTLLKIILLAFPVRWRLQRAE